MRYNYSCVTIIYRKNDHRYWRRKIRPVILQLTVIIQLFTGRERDNTNYTNRNPILIAFFILNHDLDRCVFDNAIVSSSYFFPILLLLIIKCNGVCFGLSTCPYLILFIYQGRILPCFCFQSVRVVKKKKRREKSKNKECLEGKKKCVCVCVCVWSFECKNVKIVYQTNVAR